MANLPPATVATIESHISIASYQQSAYVNVPNMLLTVAQEPDVCCAEAKQKGVACRRTQFGGTMRVAALAMLSLKHIDFITCRGCRQSIRR